MAAARAITPSPEILRVDREMPTTQARAFAYLSDTTRLHEWIPFVRGSQSDDAAAEAPQGVGSVRVIDKGVGAPVRETIHYLAPPEVMAYSARDQDFFGLVLDHLSILAVEPLGPDACRVHWIAYGESPGPLRGFIGRQLLGMVFRQGLRRAERRLRAQGG